MNMQFLSREEYHKKNWWKKLLWKDECPFCNKKEQSWHIVWEWKYWYILHNLSPYSWDDKHIMAVPYEHIKFSFELSSDHFLELEEIHKFVKNFFWEENYFSFTRESMWNRSVEHLHMHFLAWILKWKFLRKMLELQWFPIKQELNLDK